MSVKRAPLIEVNEKPPVIFVKKTGDDNSADGSDSRAYLTPAAALDNVRLRDAVNTYIGDATGGLIKIGDGTFDSPTAGLNCRRTRSLVIEGVGGIAASDAATKLKFDSGSTTPIDIRGSIGFTMRDLEVMYNVANAYAGPLVDSRQAPIGDGRGSAADTFQPKFERVLFTGDNNAGTFTAKGISAAGSDGGVVDGCAFYQLDIGIDGYDVNGSEIDYCNGWLITGMTTFGQATVPLKTGAIRNPGVGWTLRDYIVENCGSSTQGGIWVDGHRILQTFTSENGNFYDMTAMLAPLMSIRGSGIAIRGSLLSGYDRSISGSTLIKVLDACNGLVIEGDQFSNAEKGIDWGTTAGHSGVTVWSNGWMGNVGSSLTVDAATGSGGYATYRTTVPHGYSMGQRVQVTGSSNTLYNSPSSPISPVVSIPDSTHFVLKIASSSPGTFAGTATVGRASYQAVTTPHAGTVPSWPNIIQDANGNFLSGPWFLYKTGAGVTISDADFPSPPPNGTDATSYDTTTLLTKKWTRSNGAWVFVEAR